MNSKKPKKEVLPWLKAASKALYAIHRKDPITHDLNKPSVQFISSSSSEAPAQAAFGASND